MPRWGFSSSVDILRMCSAFAVLSWKGLGTGVKSIEQIRRILEDLREEIRYLQAEQSRAKEQLVFQFCQKIGFWAAVFICFVNLSTCSLLVFCFLYFGKINETANLVWFFIRHPRAQKRPLGDDCYLWCAVCSSEIDTLFLPLVCSSRLHSNIARYSFATFLFLNQWHLPH